MKEKTNDASNPNDNPRKIPWPFLAVPRFYVDEIFWLLTPAETKVLLYACRCIFGFKNRIQTRRDHISLSQFQRGKRLGDGSISHGTRLSRQTINDALDHLEHFKIIRRVSISQKDGIEWELCVEKNKVNWSALQTRDVERKLKSKKAKWGRKLQKLGTQAAKDKRRKQSIETTTPKEG